MLKEIMSAIKFMANSPVRNYATPGLTSWLIGGEANGKVRLFSSDRDTRHWVTPHSHRFNFTCLVLKGSVENILFEKGWDGANKYCVGSAVPINGGLGMYEVAMASEPVLFCEVATTYMAGDTYSMRAEQIHSIRFSQGAEVLFFEGPKVLDAVTILEPYSNGKRVPTFSVPVWMFERDPEPKAIS